jgi:hypothetical protein
MRVLVGAVESSWYGDLHPGPTELTAPVDTVLAAIATGSPLSLRGWLWPHSLRSRRSPEPLAPSQDSTDAAHRN